MLMYGNAQNIITDAVVFNITSLRDDIPRLYTLVPVNGIGRLTDYEFDVAYMHYILDNDAVFVEFFSIVYNLYIGKDVYLVMSEDNWSENLIESLLKLIQQRYGYNAVLIQCYNDYMYAKFNQEYNFEPTYGIANLDIDKNRYSYLIENMRLMNGGKPNLEV